MNQPTSLPTNKVAAGSIAGSLTVIAVYLLSLGGVEIPPEVSSALTVIISFAVSYMVKEKV